MVRAVNIERKAREDALFCINDHLRGRAARAEKTKTALIALLHISRYLAGLTTTMYA